MEDGLLKLMDLNIYVDGIISEILKYAGKRMIVISCFHPDACLMYVIVVVIVAACMSSLLPYRSQ